MHISNCCHFNTSITWQEIKGVFEHAQAGSTLLLAKVSWLGSCLTAHTRTWKSQHFLERTGEIRRWGLNWFSVRMFGELVSFVSWKCIYFYGLSLCCHYFIYIFYSTAQSQALKHNWKNTSSPQNCSCNWAFVLQSEHTMSTNRCVT